MKEVIKSLMTSFAIGTSTPPPDTRDRVCGRMSEHGPEPEANLSTLV